VSGVVTTVVSEDTKGLIGPAVDIPGDGTAAMVDSIVVLKSAEAGTQQRRRKPLQLDEFLSLVVELIGPGGS
jgi:hypothetical protein